MIVETVFSRPGVGRLIVSGILNKDFPLVQGTILFVAAAYVLINLMVDLAYAVLDPGSASARRLARHRGAQMGLLILGLLAVLAAAAPRLSPRDPIRTSPREALQPPGHAFPLGSDQYGRDVLSRVLHGARISLAVGLVAVAIAVGLGTPIGLVSGYYGGRLDVLLMRAVDVMLAFPGILLALAIVSVLPPSPAT